MRKTLVLLLALLLLVPACTWNPTTAPQVAFVPKIVQFDATPSVIKPGEVSYLRWSVTDADSVSINNGIGTVALSGQMPVSPGSTTFYTLTAKNLAGENSAGTQIIVQGTSESTTPTTTVTPPAIVYFYADRLTITTGQSVTLSWQVLGATQVTVTPIGPVIAQDRITVQPSATTTYALTATNTSGTASASITVAVQAYTTSGEETITLKPMSAESGSLVRGAGYLDYTMYTSVCAGDTISNAASRAFLSFDMSPIPHDAIVNQAILDLSSYTVMGSPSYMKGSWGNMGALEVYYVQYTDLDNKAYNQTSTLTANGNFTNYPLSPWAWDVKDSIDGQPVIQSLIQQGQPRCQFRIQFFTTTNWDSISDMLCFDNATLTIKYVLPK
jgi:hypothetical protein